MDPTSEMSGTVVLNRTLNRMACLLGLLVALNTTAGAGQHKPVKNILFIVADDLKASVVGAYGDPLCQTPNIDRLAREGMRFTRAYAQGTACAPSRPSIMYGRYTRARINASVHQSFPELLKGQGWYSTRIGKVFHMGVPGDIVAGVDGADYPQSWTERFNCAGPEEGTPGSYECLNQNIFQTSLDKRAGGHHPDRAYVAVQMDGDGSCQPDYKAATKAIELLRTHKDGPFVMALGFVRPHFPMVAPKAIFDRYPWDKMPTPERRADDWDDMPVEGIPKFTSVSKGLDKYPENQRRMWASFYAATTFMDQQLGRVLEELDRLGLRESTAVIFTSDHGYHLGEHDFWQKSNLHEEVLRVPLIIAAPGVAPGVSDAPVELADIYPTVIELAGLAIPEQCDGKSLGSVLRDPQHRIREYAFSYHGIEESEPAQYALRGERWAYMYYGPGAEELYDMNTDPGQFTNLATHPEYGPIMEELRAELARKRASLVAPASNS